MQNVVRNGTRVIIRVNNQWYQYDEACAPIGSGSMGIVYMGFHCASHMRVAIKLVRAEYANIQSIRRRAKQEASLMFMHRNLIEMLGYCELAPNQGPIWIVSKFVQGQTVDKYLAGFQKNQSSVAKKICSMFLPIFDALHYLHSSSTPIYHLDIKPSNIMVENASNIRLMDLGIASIESTSLSVQNGMMGTPNFAAPEQLDSSCGTIDARTDIYEAAVTLYELLTNANPFNSGSVHETIEMHKKIYLPENQCVPKDVYSVLRKAASPIQSERYNNVLEFKSELQSCLSTNPPKKTSFPWWIFVLSILLLVTLTVVIVLILNK